MGDWDRLTDRERLKIINEQVDDMLTNKVPAPEIVRQLKINLFKMMPGKKPHQKLIVMARYLGATEDDIATCLKMSVCGVRRIWKKYKRELKGVQHDY